MGALLQSSWGSKHSPQTSLIKLISFCSHDWTQLQDNALGLLIFFPPPHCFFINTVPWGCFLFYLEMHRCEPSAQADQKLLLVIQSSVVHTSLLIFFPGWWFPYGKYSNSCGHVTVLLAIFLLIFCLSSELYSLRKNQDISNSKKEKQPTAESKRSGTSTRTHTLMSDVWQIRKTWFCCWWWLVGLGFVWVF